MKRLIVALFVAALMASTAWANHLCLPPGTTDADMPNKNTPVNVMEVTTQYGPGWVVHYERQGKVAGLLIALDAQGVPQIIVFDPDATNQSGAYYLRKNMTTCEWVFVTPGKRL